MIVTPDPGIPDLSALDPVTLGELALKLAENGWAVVVLLLLGHTFGLVYSRSAFNRVQRDADDRIALKKEHVAELESQARHWREAHTRSEDVRAEQQELIRRIAEGLERPPAQQRGYVHVPPPAHQLDPPTYRFPAVGGGDEAGAAGA